VISPPESALADGVVGLRPLDERDRGALERSGADEAIVRAFGAPPAHTDEVVARVRAGWRDGRAAVFALHDAGAEDDCLGVVILEPREAGRADVGYWLLPEARERGRATRGLRLVAEWALRSLPIGRVQLWTTPENVASQRVAERAGFTREGVLRSYGERDGRRVDAVFFSLVAEDLEPER
jgi:[ribosomal protein S5]-alanine N-acetyltransferase